MLYATHSPHDMAALGFVAHVGFRSLVQIPPQAGVSLCQGAEPDLVFKDTANDHSRARELLGRRDTVKNRAGYQGRCKIGGQ